VHLCVRALVVLAQIVIVFVRVLLDGRDWISVLGFLATGVFVQVVKQHDKELDKKVRAAATLGCLETAQQQA
jgi:hypothetical protein